MEGDELMYSDIELKLKRKNKLLFSKESTCLQDLIQLIQQQNHRTLIMWVLDCAQITLIDFESKYPEEPRPRLCLELSKAWAKGEIKMKIAKKAILAAHAVAKEINDPAFEALCHGIGHAGATVHVETHALGLIYYELTALVLRYGQENYPLPLAEKLEYYVERLLYWQNNIDQYRTEWAEFLLDDSKKIKKNYN